jgi:uncharacterized protein (TIGR03083 family)
MTLAADAYLSHLKSDAAAMAEVARRAPLDDPVPACPGWDMHQLMAHTSGVHRWVTAMVSQRSRQPISRRELPAAPQGPAVVDWFEEGAATLIDTLAAAGPEVEVWNWSASLRSYFWFRRQAQETTVHRWDAQSVTGDVESVPVDLAIDGIDELMTLWVPDPDFSSGRWLSGSLHIHATDEDGEWTLRPSDDQVVVDRDHGKGDAALRGPASDLLLYLWNRDRPVETFGDDGVLQSWREHLRI